MMKVIRKQRRAFEKSLLACSVAVSYSRVEGFLVQPTIRFCSSSSWQTGAFPNSISLHLQKEGEFESLVQEATLDANGYALGGDFAGLAATFDPGDGSFIPIPTHLIPAAMIEWGQEPKCLEVLVSEELEEKRSSLDRTTITVLPDTGCAIDNLETTKVKDDVDLTSEWGSGTNVVGLQYELRQDDIRLETVFGTNDGYRMRVIVDLIPSESVFAIQSPMLLVYERRTNAVSSGGTLADGGGLDGRTVSLLLGEKLRKSRTFVEEEPIEDNFESNGIKHIGLPGNVTLAYGWLTDENWVIQVGYVENGTRQIVSREFCVMDSDELDFDVSSWEEAVEEL